MIINALGKKNETFSNFFILLGHGHGDSDCLSTFKILKLCIDLDDNIYFDAPTLGSNGQEQANFLNFANQERYVALSKREKERLFHFSKPDNSEQQDLIDYAVFKRQRKYHKNSQEY